MAERLIMEPITADPASFDTAMMARGVPGLPRRFAWRGTPYRVEAILGTWKETTPDRGEAYVRRHGVEVRTTCGRVMKLTGARGRRNRAPRWMLRSIRE